MNVRIPSLGRTFERAENSKKVDSLECVFACVCRYRVLCCLEMREVGWEAGGGWLFTLARLHGNHIARERHSNPHCDENEPINHIRRILFGEYQSRSCRAALKLAAVVMHSSLLLSVCNVAACRRRQS